MSEEPEEGIDMKLLTGMFDAPAYIRRARNVEQALQHIIDRAHAKRREWSEMARLRLGVLHALAGDWWGLRPFLADDEQVNVLEALRQTLEPKLRIPPEPTRSRRALRQALVELLESLERLNRRWSEYVRSIDLSHINDLRDGYNRYYLLEKSCAIKSEAVVKAGFAPLPPLDLAELQRLLPPLPVPKTVL
jgi:hypothetical protein